jgi:hypothetical protein
MEEELTLKYLDVNKMQCSNKEIKVSRRSLDTTIEMAIDYSKLLYKLYESEDEDNVYKRQSLLLKSEEIKKIADDLSEKIGYCKNCKNAREVDDVGMGAFEIMGNRNRKKD